MCRSKVIYASIAVAMLSSPAHAILAQNESSQSALTAFGPDSADRIRLSPGVPFVATSRHDEHTGPTNSSVTLMVARDSDGRFYSEARETRETPWLWGVIDPFKHTDLSWSSKSNQAHLYHNPSIIPSKPDELPPGPWQTPSTGPQSSWQIEQLGTKMIHGVLAEGMRATQGSQKDDHDANHNAAGISEEWWYSRDLQVVISTIYSDGHGGTDTTELTDIERKEPDTKLFAVPAGYQIVAQEMIMGSAPAAQRTR